jgi:hypothetical protein
VKPPQHPVGPAFHHAADQTGAWREQQKALLTDQQRLAYNRFREQADEEKQLLRRQQEETLQQRVRDEKNRLLFARPELVLRMIPGRAIKEPYANWRAYHNIRARDHQDIERIDADVVQRSDNYLEQTEIQRDREARDKQQQELSRYFESVVSREQDLNPER